jgi:hypothetical protein
MSTQHAAPRQVIRLARLSDYFGLKKSQMANVVDELVAAGLLTKPFNPAGGNGRARAVFADEVAKIQKLGVEKALAGRDEEDDAA